MQKYHCIELNVPSFFRDPRFLAWLNAHTGKGLATWHTGGKPGELSDVFVVYDHQEGDYSPLSDPENGMPAELWDRICDVPAVEAAGHCIVRLTNLCAEDDC